MTKVLKLGAIISLILLLLLSVCQICFAENTLSDINMNLQSDKTANSITNQNTTVVSSGSNTSDQDLGIGNIINILLIVVGIVLILLAIAILIRLRS